MKLHSPHIVRVFEYGDLDGVQPYIIMEFLRGRIWLQFFVTLLKCDSLKL